MKIGGFILVAVLAVLMTLGTLSELYRTGQWYLQWLDVRWWWHWIAVIYTWGSSLADINIDFHGPERELGE